MADEGCHESGRPELSVVIVNWNARAELLACLESLRRHPPRGLWEAIVVDNASSDGSVPAVREEASWARLIVNDRNTGLAAANNQGMLAARGASVLISNPDVLYSDGAIDALVDVLHRRPSAAFVVPRLLHADGELQTSAGDLPTLADALRGRQEARRRSSRGPTAGFWWDGWAHDEERVIGHGAEASYLVRRSAVTSIGPQDESFFLDWETIDWSARAADAGWEVWFCPQATVVHTAGASIKQVPHRWIIRSHLGMYRYFRKRRSPLLRPALAAAFATRAGLKLLAVSVGIPMYELAHRGRRRS